MLASTIISENIHLRATGETSDVPVTVSYAGTTATLTPNAALSIARQYRVTVSGDVSDSNGNLLESYETWTFTTGAGTFTDTTVADFIAGTPDSSAYVAQTDDGEVILAPTVGAEFYGSTLPSGWSRLEYPANSSGGTAPVSNGWVTIDGSRLLTSNEAMFTPGRSLEFAATFSGGPYQASGFGQAFLAAPWAAFDFGQAGTSMMANTSATTTSNICPGCISTAHVYRIDWSPSAVTYFIDGEQVANHAVAIGNNMRPIFADSSVGGSLLRSTGHA